MKAPASRPTLLLVDKVCPGKFHYIGLFLPLFCDKGITQTGYNTDRHKPPLPLTKFRVFLVR